MPPSGTFKANERDSTVDICVSVDPDLQDNVSVRYHSPDETFSSYPESDTESESDDSGDKGGDIGGDVSLPPLPAQPQQLFVEYDHPCLLYTSPSPRDQRGSRMPSSA